MQKGRDLFRSGLLSEAVLALEAEVQRNPGNAEAWRLLGTVQAENDDDQQVLPPCCQSCMCSISILGPLLLHWAWLGLLLSRRERGLLRARLLGH